MKKRNTLIYIISGILSVILLAYLFLNMDWEILKTAFSNIRWGWIVLALSAYLVNICLRALRFSALIYTRRIHWLEIVPVSALHNILMYLLPAKTGDVAYVFLAKNRLDVSMTEGTATLLAARFYDFAIIAVVLAVLLPFTKEDLPNWIFQASVIFCSIVLLGTLFIFAFLRFGKTSLANQIEEGDKKNLRARIRNTWYKFIAGLREIQSHGAHLRTALLTAGIWLCIYLNFYSAAQSMSLPISLYHVVIISIVMIPLTLLPLQGFMNIGTHEVGWTSVLVAFNYPYETALAIAAGSHFVLLISVVVSGLTAFFGSQFISTLSRGDHEAIS